jgi:hypothetical protein
MKNLLIILFLSILIKNQAQDCNHNVSTHILNPTNNALPSNSTEFGERFLNAFNWNLLDSDGLLAPVQLQNMQFNQNMVNLQSSSLGSYYSYIFNGEKMTYENGWELLLLNIGKYPNLMSIENNVDFADIPYIVLYNRYQGIIRVFANYGTGYLSENISINAMRIEISFEEYQLGLSNSNGMFRLNAGNDASLSNSTKVTTISALAKHPNQPSKWFSADFQIAYDPCICYHPSNLRLKFYAIENVNLALYGREIQLEQDLINGKAINSKDFLTNFELDDLGNAKDGMIMYKAMDYLVDDYITKLQAYQTKLEITNEINAKVERNLAIMKAFKFVILGGGNAAISGIANTDWFGKLLTYANDLVGKTEIKKEDLIKEAKKGLSSGLDLFITKNFVKQPLPTSPIAPTANFSEMNFQGKLAKYTDIQGPKFFTPGTYGSLGTGSPQILEYPIYPIYNNPLGIFALLESPKIQAYKQIGAEEFNDLQYNLPFGFAIGQKDIQFQRYQTWSNFYQFKILEGLKFQFNKSLDIKDYEIKASIKLFAKPNGQNNQYPTIYQCFLDPSKNYNLDADNVNLNTYQNLISKGLPKGTLLTNPDFIKLNYLDANQTTIQKDKVEAITPFIPIDAFNKFNFGIGLINEVTSYSEDVLMPGQYQEWYNQTTNSWDIIFDENNPSIEKPVIVSINNGFKYEFELELKLLIDVTYNQPRSDLSENKSTLSLTYKIPSNNINWITSPIQSTQINNTVNDLSSYSENITFKNTNFNGQNIQNCLLNGTTYTCQAWNDIKIEGDLNCSNGYTANLIAGNQIETFPESVISPEITLSIIPVLDYSQPMPEATPTYVASFCTKQNPTGENYQADTYNKTALDSLVESQNGVNNQTDLAIIKTENELDFQLFPNPSSQLTTVVVEGNESGLATLSIFDVMGKEKSLIIQAEQNQFHFDVSSLAKGMYFVKVNTIGASKTKQLIVK